MAQTQVSGSGIKDNVITNSHLHSAANIAGSKLANSGVTAGSYGSGSATLSLTINAQGLITAASTNSISTDLVNDSSPQLGGDLASNGNDIDFADNDKAIFGTGADLQIYHDGTNSTILNQTGDLRIRNAGPLYITKSSTENMIIAIPDGAVELYHNNSKKFETTSGGVSVTGNLDCDGIRMLDSAEIRLGTSDDLKIFHDGSHSYIADRGTGNLSINSSNGEIQLAFNDFAGTFEHMVRCVVNNQVELYYNGSKKFETNSSGTYTTGNVSLSENIHLADNKKIFAGAGNDLLIYHDGTSNIITSVNGNLFIQAASGENGITVNQNGAVELYHDNSKKFETTAAGGQFTGTEIKGPDNCKFVAGTSGDADFYHDGSATYLRNATGNLHIRSDNTIELQPYSGDEVYAKFINDGAVELYYDNSLKLATKTGGVEVTNANGVTDITSKGTGSNRADVRILATGTGSAYLWMDASNGDLSGADYAFIVHNNATLDLEIANYANDVIIKNRNGSIGAGGLNTAIHCHQNGSTDLHYDGTKKFETVSSGIQVTGNVKTNGISQTSGNLSISNNDTSNGVITIATNTNDCWRFEFNGDFEPHVNNSVNIGSTSKRVANIYTNDLNLSNEGSSNDVDGTWGSFTIQEGEDSLFLLNKRNGKKYKFNLTEVT
nr:endosialidase [uncultured Mediterranean phage uvMED]